MQDASSQAGFQAAGPLVAPDAGGAPRRRRGLRRWWTSLMLEDEVLEPVSDRRTPLRMVLPALAPVMAIGAVLVLREPDNLVAILSVGAGGVAIAFAALMSLVERRLERPFWLQIGTVAFFAALISMLMLVFLTLEHPRQHAHWIVFFLYFLLIGSVGLSDDPRQPICAGLLCIAGYLAVLPVVAYAARSGSSPMAARVAPELEWVANAARVALLAAATVLGAASANRGRAVRRLSLRDGLTGLLNRHAFDRCLERMACRAERRGTPMTIAMIDIDYFKRLNDTHGHAAGDAVLRWVGSWLRYSFRSSDVVARYGGEEFVVAFLDTDAEHLTDRLEALRRGIQQSSLRDPDGGSEIRITVSIGIARMPADGDQVREVLCCADERLYQAKAAGRDCIVGALASPA
jgi:diguanylate cyclase (GGDEF)-like protein